MIINEHLLNREREIPNGNIIAIVGTHYVGKTTLTRSLEERLGVVSIEERWDENPYLHANDPLQNQLWYLDQVVQSMRRAKALSHFGKNVVLDTFSYSTLIFSRMTLTKEDFRTFEETFNLVIQDLPLPDVVIYLRASTEFLYNKRRVARIASGNAPPTDETVDPSWLDMSRQIHDEIFGRWNLTPLIKIDVEERDVINNDDDFAYLVTNIPQSYNSDKLLNGEYKK